MCGGGWGEALLLPPSRSKLLFSPRTLAHPGEGQVGSNIPPGYDLGDLSRVARIPQRKNGDWDGDFVIGTQAQMSQGWSSELACRQPLGVQASGHYNRQDPRPGQVITPGPPLSCGHEKESGQQNQRPRAVLLGKDMPPTLGPRNLGPRDQPET